MAIPQYARHQTLDQLRIAALRKVAKTSNEQYPHNIQSAVLLNTNKQPLPRGPGAQGLRFSLPGNATFS
jgi:hypothetical protein